MLYLPLNLHSYHGDLTKQQVPSLLETSLRVVYKMYFHHEIRNIFDNLDAHYEMLRVCKYDRTVHNFCSIPATILSTIENGPVALCFSQTCQNAIFTEAAGWVLHTNIVGIHHCMLFFCSTQCARDVFNKS